VDNTTNFRRKAECKEARVKSETLYVESMVILDRPFELASDIEGHSNIQFAVVLKRDEDGLIVASCPTLPGCHSQGRTKDEAIRGYIASMHKHGEPLPETEVEKVEVN